MALLSLMKNLVKKIAIIPKVAYASWLIESAFDDASKGKNQESKARLESAKKYIRRLTEEGRLLEICLYYELAHYEEAYSLAEKFESEVLSVESRFLNKDEVSYLIAYSNMVRWSIRMRKGDEPCSLPEVRRFDVSLSEVRPALMRKFPLVNHVDWDCSRNADGSPSSGKG